MAAIAEFTNPHSFKRITPVPEIVFNGQIVPKNSSTEYHIRIIADVGAGFNYLPIKPQMCELLHPSPCREHTVFFANGQQECVNTEIMMDLSIFAIETGETFTRTVKAYPLIITDEDEGLALICGRDTLEEFEVIIECCRRASIQGQVIFERKNKFAPDTTSLDHFSRVRTTDDCDPIDDYFHLLDHPSEEGEVVMTHKGTHSLDKSLGKSTISEADKAAFDNLISVVPDPEGKLLGRIQTRIPWRDHKRPPINKVAVAIRDAKNINRLSASQRIMYEAAANELIDGGFAQITHGTGKHFIAITPVFKGEKVRLCVDGRMSNDYTATGTVQSRPMTECFHLFRSKRYTSVFDISKAFWRVLLDEKDQCYCSTIIDKKEISFRVLSFGCNYSPSVLELALQKVFQLALAWLHRDAPMAENSEKVAQVGETEPQRPNTLQTVNYVDDYNSRNDNENDERIQVNWYRWFLRMYGFSSSKYYSNIGPKLTSEWTTYLGYRWQPSTDLIQIKLINIAAPDWTKPVTLRMVLSAVAQYYDYMGFTLNIQLLGRQVVRSAFADLRARPIGDTETTNTFRRAVSESVKEELRNWLDIVPTAHFTSPRLVSFRTLHIFADASEECWCYEIRDEDLQLVCSRGGLCGPRDTVPRAELMALFHAIMDAKQLNLHELKVEKIYFYSDSECTIYRLRKQKLQLPIFERNRIDKMLQTLNSFQIPVRVSHISGIINPADFATRPRAEERPHIDIGELRDACMDRTNLSFHPRELRSEVTDSADDVDNLFRMFTRSERRKDRANPAVPNNQSVATTNNQSAATTNNQSVATTNDPSVATTLEKIQALSDEIRTHQDTYFPNGTYSNGTGYTVGTDGLLYHANGRIVLHCTDRVLLSKLFSVYHSEGHYGVTVMSNLMKRKFHTKGLYKFVKNAVRDCPICQQSRTQRIFRSVITGSELNVPSLASVGILSVCGIDLSPVDHRAECPHLLTTICSISKFVRTAAIKDQTAQRVTNALDQIFCATIYPRVVITDQGPCFRSKLFARWCASNNVAHLYIPVYASQYAGWVERGHQSVFLALRKLVAEFPATDWYHQLEKATKQINCFPYDGAGAENGLAPVHLVYANYLFRTDPLDTALEGNDELIKTAGYAHLQPPTHNMQELHERFQAKCQMQLEDYRDMFEARKAKIAKRLHVKLKEAKLEVGQRVRVWRPSLNKVAVQWSEERTIVEKPSLATRRVRDITGHESVEYILNLAPVGRDCSETTEPN